MDIPKEFFKLGGNFHQDSLEGEFDEARWVEQGLRSLTSQERARLRAFLDDVLGQELSDPELEELWANSGSDFFVYGPDGARSFLQMIRDRL